MLKGEEWVASNEAIDEMLYSQLMKPTSEEMKEQFRCTADAFAVDMLLAKFVQGFPLIGIVGGLTNPVYYSRISKYVQLKYRKRYLLRKLR